MKLSVIIPVFNEADTIGHVIASVLGCGIKDLELIIVNDCSSDQTAEQLARYKNHPNIRVIHHATNRGKGAAIRTAQEYVTGGAVVVQDADLEYDPADLPGLLESLAADRADAVYGSRYGKGESKHDSFWHFLGNKALTKFSNLLSHLHLTDMETCYKMMRADIFKELDLECNRFGIEPEITAKLARRGCRIEELPISYSARRYEEGKKIGWKDGVAAVWYIIKYNLFR